MRVLILTVGTRGDVVPYVALAGGLQSAGHQVALGTAAGYRDLVTAAGVPHISVGSDTLELMQAGMSSVAGPRDALRLVRRMTTAIRASLQDQWDAARSFGPDLVVYHPKTLGGLHVAERLLVPAVAALPLPFLTPTRAFPIPVIGRWPLGPAANRLSYQLNRLTAVGYGGIINSFRRRTLNLPPRPRWDDYLHHVDGRPVPTLYGYSPTVVPVPPDYPSHAHVAGYWFLPGTGSWQPPADLLDFLAAGEPPIYVGFGSMGFGEHAAARGRAIVEAVRRSGLRAVVATGWGGLIVDSQPSTIHVVDAVPHNWLFPRTAAVVHHGGAGTIAAGLQAGRPTLVCPVLGDQGFWGERIRRLELGPDPLPVHQLGTDQLARRLEQLVSEDRYRLRAQAVQATLRREDGVGRAVGVLERIVSDHEH